MNIHEIQPFVRYISKLEYSLSPEKFDGQYNSGKIYRAYDSRLLYCLSGEGEIEVNGSSCPMEKGTLILLRSGIPYRYIHNAQKNMVCMRINFDFTYKNAFLHPTPVPPGTILNFDERKIIDHSNYTDLIYITDAQELKSLTLQILDTFNSTKKYKSEECSALMKLLITKVVALYEHASNNRQSITSQLAEQVCIYIDENACNIVSAKQIGEQFSYHPNYLNRIMIKERNSTLHDYLMNAKIQKAANLLVSTDLPVAKIAEQCGFYDSSHFSKQFHAIMGYRPSKYRFL